MSREFLIYDMSQPIFHNCPGWPTYDLTEINMETVVGNDGFTSERLNLNSHTGTHLDAPYHFFPNEATIDEIPLEKFMGKAVIVNLEGIEACTAIGPEHMQKYEDKIKENSIVLINTGWCRKRGYTKEYYNDWPFLSKEGAEWLLDRKVKGVGIDGMSIGGWYEGTGRPPHEALLPRGVWLLEELYFPEELLKYDECYLAAVPLKLVGAGGSPTRAYAIIFK